MVVGPRSLTVLLKEEQGKTGIVVDQMSAAKQMMDAAERESERLRAEKGSLAAQSDYQREVEAGLRVKEAAAEGTAEELQRTQQELQALVAGAAENSRQAAQCVAPPGSGFCGEARSSVLVSMSSGQTVWEIGPWAWSQRGRRLTR